MAKHKHYVNLWQKDLFVERGIESLDRIGPAVFLRAKFKNPDALPVSFRAVLVSEVSPYTDAEKKRNIWYKLQEPLGLEVNEGEEMNATCAALLPPSGGAVYKIEARAGDKVVESTDQIETWRRLFFQIFYMKDAKEEVKVPDLQPTYDYYKTLFVDLLDVPEKKTTPIPYLENATETDLFRLVRPRYTAFLREPWVLVLVFANALPKFVEMKTGTKQYAGDVSLPSRLSGNADLVFKLPEEKYVWWGMNPTHDAMNGGKGVWLRGDAKITVEGKVFVIPKESITVDTSHSLRNGKGFNRINIKLPEAVRSHNLIFGKDAKLTITLWIVDGFSGGFAMQEQNLLTVSRTSWWHAKKTEDSEAEKLQVLNHEFGHKLGMVPKGGRRFGGPYELDGPDKLYGDLDLIYAGNNPSQQLKDELARTNNSKGHQGAHCERGATAKKKGDVWKWSGHPECTMFGATSTEDARAPQKFCGVCKNLVIRLNLNPAVPEEGPSGFKSLIDAE